MICSNPKCKKQISDRAMFCPYCGTKQEIAARKILIIAPKTIALYKTKVEVYANGKHVGRIPFDGTMYVEANEPKMFFQFKITRLIGSDPECSCVWENSSSYNAIELSHNNFLDRIKAQLI